MIARQRQDYADVVRISAEEGTQGGVDYLVVAVKGADFMTISGVVYFDLMGDSEEQVLCPLALCA